MEVSEEFRRTFQTYGYKTGFLKLAILRIVERGPIHGYALMGEIERITEDDWRPSPGSLYPALRDLQKKGLIASESEGRKKIYSITPLGERVLEEALDHVRSVLRQIGALF